MPSGIASSSLEAFSTTVRARNAGLTRHASGPPYEKEAERKLEELEMMALESKLRLLGIQRELAALRCQSFLAYMEEKLSKSRTVDNEAELQIGGGVEARAMGDVSRNSPALSRSGKHERKCRRSRSEWCITMGSVEATCGSAFRGRRDLGRRDLRPFLSEISSSMSELNAPGRET